MSVTYFVSSNGELALHRDGLVAENAAPLRQLAVQWQLAVREIQRLKHTISVLEAAHALHSKALREAVARPSVRSPYPVAHYWYRLGEVSASRWQALRQHPISLPVVLEATFNVGDKLIVYGQKRGVLGVVEIGKSGEAEWVVSANRLSHAFKAFALRQQFDLAYPKQDVVSLPSNDAELLITALNYYFKQ